ncbi:YtxH domain-containing protein [Aliibacillus thermotolerans]|uniref:YtxH domain-containing protein n=1 Tax=Aliibacillus thermotolerans TaxID=1834418 RepID=A0ABW0U598_9BACI|nr:YtxH domain-containing protein [Aliibacillus thermotolerans]MDA3128791.1 hypothetical protein [Aliibacillus thermotolerans]
MTNETKNSTGLIVGMMIGGASVAALFLNKKTREKIISYTKDASSTLKEAGQFVADNREEIMAQLKNTSNEISALLQSANNDLQIITEKTRQLKDTTLSIKEMTKQTAAELKDLKKEDRDVIPLEGTSVKRISSDSSSR